MITYTLTEAEMLEDRMRLLRAPSALRILRWIWIGMALWIATNAMKAFINGGWCAAIPELAWLSAFVVLLLASGIPVSQMARRLYRNTRWLREEQTFSWSDEGTESRTAIGQMRLLWSDFRQWDEGRTLIVIFLLANTVLILPKRAFSEDQLRDLRQHLNTHVGRPGKPALAVRA